MYSSPQWFQCFFTPWPYGRKSTERGKSKKEEKKNLWREEQEMDLRREYENTRGEREREKWKRMWREQVGGQALFYFNGAVSRPEPPLALRSSSQLLGFDVAIYIYIHFFIHVLLPRFPSLSVIPRYRNFSNLFKLLFQRWNLKMDSLAKAHSFQKFILPSYKTRIIYRFNSQVVNLSWSNSKFCRNHVRGIESWSEWFTGS